MENKKKEQIIKEYFRMWVERDFSKIADIFNENIYYSECYGPEYFHLSEIYLWIEDMLKKQKVLEWTIKQFIHSEDTTTVEWFFKEQQGEIINGFDGVSLIQFNEDGKISIIKEFESKAEHIAPYRKVYSNAE
ncbi:MAG: nuclear transport factor 2 family protein [Eubacteriales bacterium]